MDSEIFRMLVKMAIKQAKTITDDQEALDVQILYPSWESQIGKTVEVGTYLRYEDKLYKVIQQHTIQETWQPTVSQSLYTVIDKEHSGTIDDPIPWSTNMECFQGKYYVENDVIYLCTRDSGTALHHNIVNLIGLYFQAI